MVLHSKNEPKTRRNLRRSQRFSQCNQVCATKICGENNCETNFSTTMGQRNVDQYKVERKSNEMNRKRYNDYATYLSRFFAQRMQKITINAGFTCPNRDGKLSFGGCTFCDNQTFNPEYCQPTKSITQQIDEGIEFFRTKYPEQRYLAYFQAYTNTYSTLDTLKRKYEEALNHPFIDGIVIGTRPDCIDDSLLNYLTSLSRRYYVMVEYGVESTLDRTLRLINRGHTFEDSISAIKATASHGLQTGVHLILGLPQESIDDMIQHADVISELPINCLKIHQLQIIRNTAMAHQWREHPEWFVSFSAESYIQLLLRFVEHLNPEIVIERFVSQSPRNLLETGGWGLKNFEFVAKLEKAMEQNNTRQGSQWQKLNT